MSSDLLEALNSIPGAVKAIAKLVGEGADLGAAIIKIGTAKAKQVEQRIIDKTVSTSAISASSTADQIAIAKARTDREVAIAIAIKDAVISEIGSRSGEVAERALQHGVNRLIDEQLNREAVVAKAVFNLLEAPPTQTTRESPTTDWLNVFGGFAEKANSETLREHYSQILEGEIRQPGSFSFQTLHMASILDQRLAILIEEMMGWIVQGDFIPTVDKLNKGILYENILTLDSIGFLRVANFSSYFEMNAEGKNSIQLDDGWIILSGAPGAITTISSARLTTAGREIMSILLKPKQRTSELLELMLPALTTSGVKAVFAATA